MRKEFKSIVLKLATAIAIDGDVVRAGSLVEVDEATAKNLLHRGKAELATAEDDVDLDGETSGVDLPKLNKAQLLELAKGHNVEGADGMNKAELVAAIEAAEAEKAE